MNPIDAVLVVLQQCQRGGILEGFWLIRIERTPLGAHLVHLYQPKEGTTPGTFGWDGTFHSINTEDVVLPYIEAGETTPTTIDLYERLLTTLRGLKEM